MEHCSVLTKLRIVPHIFDQYLRDSDILFRAHGVFVVVDDEAELEEPYEIFNEVEMIRLDKRIIRDFNDGELGVIIFKAKIEKELLEFVSDRNLVYEEVDHLLTTRYPDWLIDSINEKLCRIYNSVDDISN